MLWLWKERKKERKKGRVWMKRGGDGGFVIVFAFLLWVGVIYDCIGFCIGG